MIFPLSQKQAKRQPLFLTAQCPTGGPGEGLETCSAACESGSFHNNPQTCLLVGADNSIYLSGLVRELTESSKMLGKCPTQSDHPINGDCPEDGIVQSVFNPSMLTS